MPRPAVPRDLDAFFDANARRLRAGLDDFLRIPSVSAKAEHAATIDKAVFPGSQGGPLEHAVAGKAVA